MRNYKFVLLAILCLALTQLNAAIYNFNTEGSYTNVANWDVYPGTTIAASDTIVLHTKCTIAAGVTINLSGVMQMGPCLSSDFKPITVHGTIDVAIGAYIKQGCTTFYLNCSATSIIKNAYVIEVPIISSGIITGYNNFAKISCNGCTIKPGGDGVVGIMFCTTMDLDDANFVFEFAANNSNDRIECSSSVVGSGTTTIDYDLLGSYLPGSSSYGLWTHNIIQASYTNFNSIVVVKPSATPKVHYEVRDFNGLVQIKQFKEYNFDGAINNLYNEAENWDTTGRYDGYPGLNPNSHNDIFTTADCSIPLNTQVNISGKLNCNGTMTNWGQLGLSPTDGITLDIFNHGDLSLYGQLYVDGALTNYNNIRSGNGANTTLVNTSSNYGKIRLQNNASMESFSYFRNFDSVILVDNSYFHSPVLIENRGNFYVGENAEVGKDSLTHVLRNYLPNGIFENHGNMLLAIYNENIVTGSGNFQSIWGPGTCSPGPGIKTIKTQRYIALDGANLQLEIEDNDNYDQLCVTTDNGNNLIDETITIDLSNYEVTSADCIEFEIITHPNVPVQIDSVGVINLGSHDWDLITSDSNVVFKLIPRESENNALDFKGSADSSYIHVPHNLGDIHTIEFLFFPNKILKNEPGDNLFSLNGSAFQYIWTMGTSSSLPDETMTITGESGRMYTQFPFKREWYHVAIVSNGSVYHQVYIDGVLEPSFVDPSGIYPTIYHMNDFQIGARKPYPQGYTQGFFNGRMDEIRLWSTLRTPSQIVDNFDGELVTTDTVGLQAYYKMNQGIAYEDNTCSNLLKDFSINNRNGTLHNFSLTAGNRSNWVRSRHCISNFHRTNEFTEGGDGIDWFDDENWSLGRVPNVCDEVIIREDTQVTITAVNAKCFTIDIQGELDNSLGKSLEMVAPAN